MVSLVPAWATGDPVSRKKERGGEEADTNLTVIEHNDGTEMRH